jgi:hypothetical protein
MRSCIRLLLRETAVTRSFAAVGSNPLNGNQSIRYRAGYPVLDGRRLVALLARVPDVFRAVDFFAGAAPAAFESDAEPDDEDAGAEAVVPEAFVAEAFVAGGAAALAGVADDWPFDRWDNSRISNAVPPTASSTGHSTSPAAPTAPSVSAAAGVEWLPLLNPFRTPAAVPLTPPMTPLTAAPPTAPAAAVVAFAVRVTTRTAP